MESNVATKEDIKMILDLLRDFKDDVNRRFEQVDKRFEQVNKQFEQVDKRFEQVNKQFEQVDKRFEQMIELIRDEKNERGKMEDKLEKVYESRDKVKISFGWQWGAISMLIAVFAAFLGGGLSLAFLQ